MYQRLNPAAGVTFSPSDRLNLYAGYGEGSRAPTSIELGCADPTQPCKLPNALAGDPPLDQVVTRTFEVGARGGNRNGVSWNAGVFHAENHHDILFVASTQTGFGYFKNFGETRRQGIELGVNSRMGRVTIGSGYTFLDATYQSSETVDGGGNSTNDSALAGVKGVEGTIQIVPGDRIPLIPRHMLKAYADVEVMPKLSVDLDVIAMSSSYARGNEHNLSQTDGTYYLGNGTSPGYGIVNLGGRYDLSKRLQIVAQLNNVFEAYVTASQLQRPASPPPARSSPGAAGRERRFPCRAWPSRRQARRGRSGPISQGKGRPAAYALRASASLAVAKRRREGRPLRCSRGGGRPLHAKLSADALFPASASASRRWVSHGSALHADPRAVRAVREPAERRRRQRLHLRPQRRAAVPDASSGAEVEVALLVPQHEQPRWRGHRLAHRPHRYRPRVRFVLAARGGHGCGPAAGRLATRIARCSRSASSSRLTSTRITSDKTERRLRAGTGQHQIGARPLTVPPLSHA